MEDRSIIEHLTSGVFGDRLLGEISQSFQSLIGFGSTTAGLLIDDEFRAEIEEQLRKATEAEIKSESYRQALNMCDVFATFAREQKLADFKFVVLFTRKFQSAYRKTVDLDNMKIELETGIVPLNDIISVQAKEASKSSKFDLFYVYTTSRNVAGTKDLGKSFIDCLRRTYKSSL